MVRSQLSVVLSSDGLGLSEREAGRPIRTTDYGPLTTDHRFMKTDSNAPRVLVADDQPDVLEALRLLLKGEGYRTELSSSPAEALAALEKRDFDLALIDLNYARDTTSGEEGLELLSRLQTVDSSLPVVVMTAKASTRPTATISSSSHPLPCRRATTLVQVTPMPPGLTALTRNGASS